MPPPCHAIPNCCRLLCAFLKVSSRPPTQPMPPLQPQPTPRNFTDKRLVLAHDRITPWAKFYPGSSIDNTSAVSPPRPNKHLQPWLEYRVGGDLFGIGVTFRSHWEIQCLLYAGFVIEYPSFNGKRAKFSPKVVHNCAKRVTPTFHAEYPVTQLPNFLIHCSEFST